ncbi:MAG: SDR family NAD(P)-dependent oxidoreductase [Candidatus Sericytochromatia bacterium]
MKLRHQVALVTGGSGGLGSAIGKKLVAEGARLCIHYHRSEAKARALAAELSPVGSVLALQADLRQEAEVRALIRDCVAHFGRLDILVNNAGWSRLVDAADLEGLDEEVFENTLKLKIHAPIYCVRAARPFLAASGRGSVVNITSVAGLAAKGSSLVYAAANAALTNLTRSLALALAPEIRVNAVAPGFVETGWIWPADGRARERIARNNHIGRTVEPYEVADLVYFLCAQAPGITGEEIVLDGGIGRLGVRRT